jgi:hypothetical protein
MSEKQTKPNNCATCNHKRHPDGGWCYMFRSAPNTACAQHTGHRLTLHQVVQLQMAAAKGAPQ